MDFNTAWPKCDVPNAFKVGDGECDELYNKEECGYDGGDCCPYEDDDEHFFNGVCDGGYFNTLACSKFIIGYGVLPLIVFCALFAQCSISGISIICHVNPSFVISCASSP